MFALLVLLLPLKSPSSSEVEVLNTLPEGRRWSGQSLDFRKPEDCFTTENQDSDISFWLLKCGTCFTSFLCADSHSTLSLPRGRNFALWWAVMQVRLWTEGYVCLRKPESHMHPATSTVGWKNDLVESDCQASGRSLLYLHQWLSDLGWGYPRLIFLLVKTSPVSIWLPGLNERTRMNCPEQCGHRVSIKCWLGGRVASALTTWGFGMPYSLWGIQKFMVCEGMVSLDSACTFWTRVSEMGDFLSPGGRQSWRDGRRRRGTRETVLSLADYLKEQG